MDDLVKGGQGREPRDLTVPAFAIVAIVAAGVAVCFVLAAMGGVA